MSYLDLLEAKFHKTERKFRDDFEKYYFETLEQCSMKNKPETTFTTPGAAIDWMLEKPEKRTVSYQGHIYRMSLSLYLEYQDYTGKFSAGGGKMAFYSFGPFTGHETRDAADELHDACAELAAAFDDRNVTGEKLENFAKAILAARE